MKTISLLLLVGLAISLTACMSVPSVNTKPMMAEFQLQTTINPTIILRVLTWAPTPYAKEIFDGLLNDEIVLKYDLNQLENISFTKNDSILTLTFGKLPSELDTSSNWIYATGMITSIYHLYKDQSNIYYGFKVMKTVISDPLYANRPFPLEFKNAIASLNVSKAEFENYTKANIVVSENSIFVK